jgi:hypothetical protein
MQKTYLFSVQIGMPLANALNSVGYMDTVRFLTISVLDFGSQVHDAILMNVYLDVRNPRGVGILEWGVYGQGEGNEEFSLQATGDQGGRILSQLGGFPSKQRGLERGAKGIQQGEIKSKGIAPCIL